MSSIKLKSLLLNLYPELAHLKFFNQITAAIIPALTPKLKQVVRWGIPIITVILVSVIGVNLGKLILGLFWPKQIVPAPIELITPAPTSTFQSSFLPLKQSLEDFNPNLPDPLPPIFDEKISLEPIVE